jgi:hypothetical protein
MLIPEKKELCDLSKCALIVLSGMGLCVFGTAFTLAYLDYISLIDFSIGVGVGFGGGTFTAAGTALGIKRFGFLDKKEVKEDSRLINDSVNEPSERMER